MKPKLLWCVAVAPLTFLLNLTVSYALAAQSCATPRPVLLSVLALGSLAIIVASGVWAWARGRASDPLLGAVGAGGAVVFGLADLAMFAAVLIVPPCAP